MNTRTSHSLNSRYVNPGQGRTHKCFQSDQIQDEGVFYLLASEKIFFKGVGEIGRVKGGSGKLMEKSGEIKMGNERNGSLCTKTCKNAPN